MRPHTIRLVIVCSIVLAAAVGLQGKSQKLPASAHSVQDSENPLLSRFQTFSATVTGGIARDHDRKIYRSGKWMRLDFDDSYRVNDLDTLEMWSVGANRCVKFLRPDAGSYPFTAYHNFKVERTHVAEKETVDGHVCKIEILTLTPRDDRPIVATMKMWEADDLEGFPIRIEVSEGGQTLTSTYTNVSLKAPDPQLFKHPAKCGAGLQLGQQGVVKLGKGL